MPRHATITSFKKGDIPWNKGQKIDTEKYPDYGGKGKKRPGVHPPTEFKKGHQTWCEGVHPTKHPAWKGFRMTERRIAGPGNTFKKILILDIGCCEMCGIGDKRVLVLHHKDENKLNNLKDNLQLLCANCHLIVHNKRGELNS